ncbi:LysM peptidoglycan-binding domain-containing protein [Gordonia jacobaea]|uniref:LysM peptidoglycan-binding domain-containing protein n=1 Tax=Gordonia jacobaea TaxID=122202 RepID=UPI003D70515B
MTSLMTNPVTRTIPSTSSASAATPPTTRSATPRPASTTRPRVHRATVVSGRAPSNPVRSDELRVAGHVRTTESRRTAGADVMPQPRRRIAFDHGTSTRPAGTRCAGGVGELVAARRRRAAFLAVLAGVGLALTVWVVGTVGADYQRASMPSSTSTQVVHVRSGESLSSIAARVAPDVPRQTVIDEIIDLNDLPSSGLRVGQPLVTPAYR